MGGTTENHASLLQHLSQVVGTSPAALALFFSILAAYPIALVHRYTLYGKPPGVQHIFFTLTGLIIGYLNFGFDILHTTVTLLVVYAILKTIGGTLHSVILTFGFSLGYLLVGYIKTETDSYDIVWTMPQCVLVLKLSGLAFDIYDGSFPEESLSKENKKVALREVPSFLEVAAFAYFPTGFLVGPHFSMKRYQDFVSGKLKQINQNGLPECVVPAVKVMALGFLFIAMHFIGTTSFTTDFILGPKFTETPFLRRIIYLGLWSHFTMHKYIGTWLLCEGSCTLIGLTYNGTDEKGIAKWDGCSNVRVLLFEGAQNFYRDYISSFNTNTNHWVLQYIYKRLKFLGNRYYSQIGVLLFLAIWHGFHSGYYVTFGMEFLVVAVEKDIEGVLNRSEAFQNFLQKPGVKQIIWVVMKFYTIVFMGPCVAPLALLSYERWWPLYKNTYFYAPLVWSSWFLLKPVLKPVLIPKRAHKE